MEKGINQSTGETPASLPTHTQLCFSLPTPNFFSGLAFLKTIQRPTLYGLYELRGDSLTGYLAILHGVAKSLSLLDR